MRNLEIAKYLANVLAVARSDGVINPKEQLVLQHVQDEVGAKKKDIKDAEKLLARQDYELTPSGRYSGEKKEIQKRMSYRLIRRSRIT